VRIQISGSVKNQIKSNYGRWKVDDKFRSFLLCKLTLIFEEYDAEVDPVVGGREYLESPMSDRTIDEDFEEALAKEVATAGELGSPETPLVASKLFEG
jgi:hypothetical protein